MCPVCLELWSQTVQAIWPSGEGVGVGGGAEMEESDRTGFTLGVVRGLRASFRNR